MSIRVRFANCRINRFAARYRPGIGNSLHLSRSLYHCGCAGFDHIRLRVFSASIGFWFCRTNNSQELPQWFRPDGVDQAEIWRCHGHISQHPNVRRTFLNLQNWYPNRCFTGLSRSFWTWSLNCQPSSKSSTPYRGSTGFRLLSSKWSSPQSTRP